MSCLSIQKLFALYICWNFISLGLQKRVVSLLLSHIIAFPKSFNQFQRGIHWCRAGTETVVVSSVIDVPNMWFMNALLDFGQLCYYYSIPIDGEVSNGPGPCQPCFVSSRAIFVIVSCRPVYSSCHAVF